MMSKSYQSVTNCVMCRPQRGQEASQQPLLVALGFYGPRSALKVWIHAATSIPYPYLLQADQGYCRLLIGLLLYFCDNVRWQKSSWTKYCIELAAFELLSDSQCTWPSKIMFVYCRQLLMQTLPRLQGAQMKPFRLKILKQLRGKNGVWTDEVLMQCSELLMLINRTYCGLDMRTFWISIESRHAEYQSCLLTSRIEIERIAPVVVRWIVYLHSMFTNFFLPRCATHRERLNRHEYLLLQDAFRTEPLTIHDELNHMRCRAIFCKYAGGVNKRYGGDGLCWTGLSDVDPLKSLA